MKRKLLQTLLIIIGICAISCSKDLGINDAIAPEAQTINPEHLALIESMGLCIEGIIELEDDYVVEGDIALSKEAVKSYLSKPQTRQARWGDHVNQSFVEDIRVSTVALTNDSWEQALIKAMKAWNDIPNCPVYFRHVGNWAGEVNVNMDATIRNSTIAYANMPLWGVPGLGIRINPDYNSMHPDRKVHVMVHELGHIVALGHTDYRNKGENEGNSGNATSYIAGTPKEEDNSVMHSTYIEEWDFSSPNGSFTTGDIAAIQAKYGTPIWSREIVGPEEWWPVNSPTYTLNLGTNLLIDNLYVKWYFNNSLEYYSSSFSFTPQSPPSGQFTLRAVIGYGGKNYEASKVITAFNPSITGNSSPTLNTTVNYSVPTSLPDGVSFIGWNVTGGAYTMISQPNNPSLYIRFETAAKYTLIANFRLPGGTNYPAPKAIELLHVPIISADKTQVQYGSPVIFTVNNPKPGVTYQWRKDGQIEQGENGSSVTLRKQYGELIVRPLANFPPDALPTTMMVDCRAVNSEGGVSDWSNLVTITVGSSNGGGLILPPL